MSRQRGLHLKTGENLKQAPVVGFGMEQYCNRSLDLEAGQGETTNRVLMGKEAPSSSGASRQRIMENRISKAGLKHL